MKKQLIIFGAGETGTLARFYFDHDSEYKVVAYCADDKFVKSKRFDGLPLVKWSEVDKKYEMEKVDMHVAVNYDQMNRLRQKKYEQVKKRGYRLASYVSSKSALWKDLSVGENCFVLENQTIQPTVRIGNNVVIWSGNHLGHNSEVGDHTYISSHVVVSGHCKIGERCFLGVNATLRDKITLGDETFVTMGALVAADTGKGDVVLAGRGVVFEGGSEKAEKIKSKYFGI
ncbi:acetyltransferase [Pseudomonadota bacterium]